MRVPALATVVMATAIAAVAQQPLTLQMSGGRVTLHARNVPVRMILAEWTRVGGTQIVNGDRVAGAPLTLDLEGVSEREALEIILRGVAGYILAAQDPGAVGPSAFRRVMIIPTSVAPRNPPPPPTVAGGIIRPIAPRQVQEPVTADGDMTAEGAGADVNVPQIDSRTAPPTALPPVVQPPALFIPPTAPVETGQGQLPQQTKSTVPASPSNPFGVPAGSTSRPGEITPAPAPPKPAAPPIITNPFVTIPPNTSPN